MANYILPMHWASALTNNDWSGLELDGDADNLRRWLEAEQPGSCLSCTDQLIITRHHDARNVVPVLCACLMFTFTGESNV